MMNPETNRFEPVEQVEAVEQKNHLDKIFKQFIQKDGTPVPQQNPVFEIGETFDLKGYRFKISDIKSDKLILDPVGPGNRIVKLKGKKSKRSRKKRNRR
jgi:uncharacterized Zn finger protein